MAVVTRVPGFRQLRKTQVAAYIRVSSTRDSQDESYETQAAYYLRKIRENPDWELVDIYGERISGTHADNRPEFQRLIRDAMDGRIDLILVKSVSRWARNRLDGLDAIKLLTGNGVHIIFEQEGIDTRTPGILLQLSLAQSVAEAESESISENIKWIYRQKTAQRQFWAKQGAYFGYDTHGDVFTENGDGKYVRYIFGRYLEGSAPAVIADELNRMGVKTSKGKEWDYYSIKRILSNEVYVGDVIFHKKPSRNVITREIDKGWKPVYMKDHHKGIIDRDVWDAAQTELERQKRKKRAPKYTMEDKKRDRAKLAFQLVRDGKSTAEEVAEGMGMCVASANNYLRKLKAEGRVRKNDCGWEAV